MLLDRWAGDYCGSSMIPCGWPQTDWSLKRPVRAIIPEYGGRGGHPTLIPAGIVARLVIAHCPQGLGQFWADHPELCQRVAVEDASVVRDVDQARDLRGVQ